MTAARQVWWKALLAVWLGGCACAPSVELDTSVPDGGVALDAPPDALDAPGPSVVRSEHAPVLAPACGARSAALDDPSTYDTREELARALAEARCAFAVRCSESVELECDPLIGRVGLLWSSIDIELAELCLRAWEDAPCTANGVGAAVPLRICRPLMAGVYPNGHACSDDAHCIDRCRDDLVGDCTGTCVSSDPPVCDPPCAVEATCTAGGVCTLLPAPGEACLGLSCRPSSHCVEGTCIASPSEGERCHEQRITMSDVYYWCAEGLVCDVDLRCRPPRVVAEGESCTGASFCAEGARCSRVDRICELPGELGDRCDAYFMVAASVCTEGLFCDDALDEEPLVGRCGPPRAAGEPCSTAALCGPSLHCLVSDWDPFEPGPTRCGVLSGPGCVCDASHFCPNGWRCIEGTCRVAGLGDASCTTETDCGFQESCTDGRCTLAVIGMPCTAARTCAEGFCSAREPGGAAPGVCLPLRGLGEPCQQDEQCHRPDVCGPDGLCSRDPADLECAGIS